MGSTTANTAEFQQAGKPVAQAIYIVDANGNPISSTNALNVNASFSASSVAINDPTTTTQKMAVDASGNASVKLGAAIPAGTNVIGHVIVDSGTITASNPSVGADGSAIPASSTLIGASDGTNLQQLLVESASNRNLRIGIYSGANEATVTGSNALKVDGSGVTQPVSGTVTANAGTGNFTVVQATGSNLHAVLDSGSTTAVTQATAANLNGTMTIQAVTGASLAADQTNSELRVSLYGKNSAAGDTAVHVNNTGDVYVQGDFAEQTGLSANALNADLVPSTDVSAYKWVCLQIISLPSATVTFQVSNDNSNWQPTTLYQSDDPSKAVNNTGLARTYVGPIVGRYFRARLTSFSSGPVTGVAEFYTSAGSWVLNSVSATQGGSWNVNSGSDITVFASGAQTATQTQSDQTNSTNARGIKVVLDMTNVGSSPSVTLEIDGKDVASGKYYSILTGAAVTTVSTNVYAIYPGLTASANIAANDVLPHTWRVKVVANNSNSGTYSVGASLIP